MKIGVAAHGLFPKTFHTTMSEGDGILGCRGLWGPEGDEGCIGDWLGGWVSMAYMGYYVLLGMPQEIHKFKEHSFVTCATYLWLTSIFGMRCANRQPLVICAIYDGMLKAVRVSPLDEVIGTLNCRLSWA